MNTASTGASARTSEVDITKGRTGPVWRQYLRAMGPGLVTGASDDDPSGIATYSQAGAKFGFSFLWSALLTLPLMAAVQEICDRTALATGIGLGELAVKRFQRAGRTIVAALLWSPSSWPTPSTLPPTCWLSAPGCNCSMPARPGSGH